MITSILLCATVAVQPRTVTFVHPCAHSSVVLAALGEELGMKIEPSGSVNDDYFLLRFDAVPVKDALDKIAETLNATWTEKSGVRYLGRTHAQELAEEKEALMGMVRGVEKFLADNPVEGDYTPEVARDLILRSIELQSDRGNAQFNVQLRSLSTKSPGTRFLMRVLASFDPEVLASIEEGWAVRYAPNPTGGQRPLPAGGVRAYNQFLQETAIHREAIEATGALMQLPTIRDFSSLTSPYKAMLGSHDAAFVEFQRGRERLMVQLRLPGGLYYSVIATVSILANEVAIPPDPALAALESKQEISPLLQKASELMFSWFSGSPDGLLVKVPSEVQEVFSKPTENDPLTVLGSDWILQSAKELNLNVVALLPDLAAFVPLMVMQQGAETLGQYWSLTAVPDFAMRSSVSDGWLTVEPIYRSLTRKDRLSRVAIERFIESYEKIGSKSLDPVADLVGQANSQLSLMFSLALAAIGLGESSVLSGLNDYGDLDALRLYSLLPPSARKEARESGHRIAVDSLKGDASKFATRLLFGRQSIVEELRANPSATDDIFGRPMTGEGINAQDALAAGVPRGSAIIVHVFTHQAVFPKRMQDGSQYRGSGLTAGQLAGQIADAEYNSYAGPDASLLAVVEVEQLVIEFIFPDIGYVYADAKVDHVGRDTKYASLQDMDPDWKKEYDEKLKQSRKMYGEMAKARAERKNPPPSR
ncbi:MAG: hypothetical protein IH944_10690 [Armatimonadetes bacterium]|nr:hypothetical protein [Armatimonadota bacterium]